MVSSILNRKFLQ